MADDRSNCSEMVGKMMTLKSPAATSAAALAGLMACSSSPIVVAATMKGSDVA